MSTILNCGVNSWDQFQVLCLHRKHFTYWTIPPSGVLFLKLSSYKTNEGYTFCVVHAFACYLICSIKQYHRSSLHSTQEKIMHKEAMQLFPGEIAVSSRTVFLNTSLLNAKWLCLFFSVLPIEKIKWWAESYKLKATKPNEALWRVQVLHLQINITWTHISHSWAPC